MNLTKLQYAQIMRCHWQIIIQCIKHAHENASFNDIKELALELAYFSVTGHKLDYCFKFDCASCEYAVHNNYDGIRIGYIAGLFILCQCNKICLLHNLWPDGCESEDSPYLRCVSFYADNEYNLAIIEAQLIVDESTKIINQLINNEQG